MVEPDDIEALKAALAKALARTRVAEARLADERAACLAAEAKVSSIDALIVSLKLLIEKLRRELYGQRSERKARLLDQMELELEELEASATEDELEAEMAALRSGWPAASADQGTAEVKAFTRRKPSKKPFPEHLPRERVVVPGPTSCDGCGSTKLSKFGEDVTETLEVIPRQMSRSAGAKRRRSGMAGPDLRRDAAAGGVKGDPICPRKVHLLAQGRFLGARAFRSRQRPSI